MVSVAHIVEKNIREKPFLQEALSRGIINYGALADELLPIIKTELNKDVKHAAVMMALRRYTDRMNQKLKSPNLQKSIPSLTIKSQLFAVSLPKSADTIKIAHAIRSKVNSQEYTIEITEGINEISIVTNMKFYDEFCKLVQDKNIIKKIIKNVAALTIHLPLSTINATGVYFSFMRTLAWENISIIEIVSTFTELTMILQEEHVTRAYDILRNQKI